MGFRHGADAFRLPEPTLQTRRSLAARHLDDARRHLIEASKALDAIGAGRVGMHVFCATDAVDDARAMLTERAD